MKLKILNMFLLVLTLSVTSVTVYAEENSAVSEEYQIKAALIYNFLKFVDWPQQKQSEPNAPVILGVIGNAPLEKAFKPVIKGKVSMVKGRPVVVKFFKSFEEIKSSNQDNQENMQKELDALRKCHLLFICSSEQENFVNILDVVKDSSTLTVGESSGFLGLGGMVNLLAEKDKIRFEINMVPIQKANLTVSSQLLQLAKKVLKD